MTVRRFAAIVILFLLIASWAVGVIGSEPINVLQNTWALGVDESTGCPGDIADGWTHSATVSLSRCPKNPSPFGIDEPGAAFKNGPVSGGGQSGVETTSSQLFTLPYAESHELTFSALIVCVRCDYLIAELYGDDVYLGELLSYTPGAASCGAYKWYRYCGEPLTVPHAAEYEIVIRTRWTAGNSLGVKWTGLELVDTAVLPTPTPTLEPTATATAVPPTPAPEPTPTLNYLPLFLNEGAYELICEAGDLTINGNLVNCEALD